MVLFLGQVTEIQRTLSGAIADKSRAQEALRDAEETLAAAASDLATARAGLGDAGALRSAAQDEAAQSQRALDAASAQVMSAQDALQTAQADLEAAAPPPGSVRRSRRRRQATPAEPIANCVSIRAKPVRRHSLKLKLRRICSSNRLYEFKQMCELKRWNEDARQFHCCFAVSGSFGATSDRETRLRCDTLITKATDLVVHAGLDGRKARCSLSCRNAKLFHSMQCKPGLPWADCSSGSSQGPASKLCKIPLERVFLHQRHKCGFLSSLRTLSQNQSPKKVKSTS